jgi:hypothetical protein
LVFGTARGGTHLTYTTTKTLGNGQGKLPKFGDVRGHGGLIVGPGSTYKGGRYAVRNLRFPEPLPANIEALLHEGKRRDRSTDDPVPGVTVDDPRNVQYFADWCAGNPVHTIATPHGEVAEPCIEGQGGNNMLAATGAVAHDYGISADMGYVKALEHHNPRCEPPWDADEYERHFFSGYHSASSPLGHRAPKRTYEYLFKPYVVTSDGEKIADLPQPLRMQSFTQLLAKEPQPVAEIIPDRIEKGVVNFLSGPGGSHKSRLALQYCVCIGAQISVFGKMPAEVMPVYVCAEDDEAEIIRRMHKFAKRLDVHPDAIKETTGYLDRSNLDNALVRMSERGGYELTPFYYQLGDFVTGLSGHKFVVLDSCYDFVRFDGNAKVNEDAVNVFVKVVLGGFCHQTNSTLLIPWHPSYAGQERGDGSGWSVAWHNAPRVRDQIKRKGEGDAFELTAVKRNHGSLPDPLTLHYSDGALLPRADIELSEQRAADREAIISVAILMAKRGIPIQRQKRIGNTELDLLREKFDCEARNKEVKDLLDRAVIDGRLEYLRGNKYRSAGYYPLDAGEELAKDAKRGKNQGKNQAKTTPKTGAKTTQKPGKNRG